MANKRVKRSLFVKILTRIFLFDLWPARLGHKSESVRATNLRGKDLVRNSTHRGGSVAEWSACRTHNPAVPGSSPALTTTWICFSVAPSSTTRPRLYISNWFASGQLGFLTMSCLIWIICFSCLLSHTSTYAKALPRVNKDHIYIFYL